MDDFDYEEIVQGDDLGSGDSKVDYKKLLDKYGSDVAKAAADGNIDNILKAQGLEGAIKLDLKKGEIEVNGIKIKISDKWARRE